MKLFQQLENHLWEAAKMLRYVDTLEPEPRIEVANALKALREAEASVRAAGGNRMNEGISIKGMSQGWLDKEAEKSNKMLRAWMLEETGEVDAALQLYVEAAETEEQLAEYCRSLGLLEKAYISAVSAAGCWARAGDLYRALQQYDALINDSTLTPKMRNHVCEIAERLREQRREWSALRLQKEHIAKYGSEAVARSEEPAPVA